jgi:hypothetical protein
MLRTAIPIAAPLVGRLLLTVAVGLMVKKLGIVLREWIGDLTWSISSGAVETLEMERY